MQLPFETNNLLSFKPVKILTRETIVTTSENLRMKAEEHSPATIFTCQEKRGKRGKRFSGEQIKSLESIFKLETKLEPSQKQQLAKDLGLQPRQVAIWFQNKRARWKSKQIEEDYRELQANFDSLSMQFESLKQENESLLTQFEMLRSPNGGHSRSKDSEENGTNNGPYKFKEEASGLNEGLDHHEIMYEDHNEAGLIKNIEEKEETETFRFDEYGNRSLASPEELCGLFSQSCEASNWWDF